MWRKWKPTENRVLEKGGVDQHVKWPEVMFQEPVLELSECVCGIERAVYVPGDPGSLSPADHPIETLAVRQTRRQTDVLSINCI